MQAAEAMTGTGTAYTCCNVWSQSRIPTRSLVVASDERRARCPTCGALLGKTFGMVGRQLAENYEQLRLAAVLTAQACPNGCQHGILERA
jgi:hypothetical protein